MTMTGTEALGRLLARREARVAAATFTKGEGGLFTGSESDGSGDTQKGHRDGEAHSDARVHRAIREGIEALHGSSVHSRTMDITDGQGRTRSLELSNAHETTRPDTPNSEIVPTIHQAAESPEGMTLDRPIVVNGISVDARVLPVAGEPGFDKNPGMSRDSGGGTAMMGAVVVAKKKTPEELDAEKKAAEAAKAAEDAKAADPNALPDPAATANPQPPQLQPKKVPVTDEAGKPVTDKKGEPVLADAPPGQEPAVEPVVDETGEPVKDEDGDPVLTEKTPPPPGAGGGGAATPRQIQENAERDQRIEDLEGMVKELRTELDDIEQLAVNNAMADLDQFTAEGGEGEMPESFAAAVAEKYELPPAFVAGLDARVALPPGFVAAVEEKYELPTYTPGSFTAGILALNTINAARKALPDDDKPKKQGFLDKLIYGKNPDPEKDDEKKKKGETEGEGDERWTKAENGEFNGSKAK